MKNIFKRRGNEHKKKQNKTKDIICTHIQCVVKEFWPEAEFTHSDCQEPLETQINTSKMVSFSFHSTCYRFIWTGILSFVFKVPSSCGSDFPKGPNIFILFLRLIYFQVDSWFAWSLWNIFQFFQSDESEKRKPIKYITVGCNTCYNFTYRHCSYDDGGGWSVMVKVSDRKIKWYGTYYVVRTRYSESERISLRTHFNWLDDER